MMTGASAAQWQRGALSVPMQFMTFSARMLESIFSPVLSRDERIRLAIAQTLYFGAAGWGVSSVLDKWILDRGWQWEEDFYLTVKYGSLDALLSVSGITNGEVAFGERIAAAEGIHQLIENWGDKSVVDVAIGPGGQLFKDVITDSYELAANAINGRTALTEGDLRKVFRNITSLNKGYQAWYLWKTGEFLSRDDDPTFAGASPTVAIGLLAGATPTEASAVYNAQDYLKDRKAILKKTGLRLKEMMREGRRAFEEERFEDYNVIMKQFSHAISILEPHEAREVKRFYENESETFSSSLQERLWRKGRQVLPPMESN
jgi:hypothetical protein